MPWILCLWWGAAMIRRGDRVEILPEFQDPGDDTFEWRAMDDEENGRVTICPVSIDLTFKPRSVVLTSQIRPWSDSN
jgi:hypothetical protein